MSRRKRSSSDATVRPFIDPEDFRVMEPTAYEEPPSYRAWRRIPKSKRSSDDPNLLPFLDPEFVKAMERTPYRAPARQVMKRGTSPSTAPSLFDALAGWQAAALEQQQAELDLLVKPETGEGESAYAGYAKVAA